MFAFIGLPPFIKNVAQKSPPQGKGEGAVK